MMTEQERLERFQQELLDLQRKYGVLFQINQQRADIVRDGQKRVELWLEVDPVLDPNWQPPPAAQEQSRQVVDGA